MTVSRRSVSSRTCAHPADPCERLGVEQQKQAGDAGVETDGVVVQQKVDLGPTVVVGKGDGRLAGGIGWHA